MALIIEDGNGLDNADSYIDTAFADAYFLKRGVTEWADLTNKEALIVRAMDYIENNYTFIGSKLLETQSLSFPRVIDGATIFPTALKNAACELAIKSNDDDLLADGEKTTIREKVGTLEVEYDPNQSNTKTYRFVDKLLSPYIENQYAFNHKVSRG